MKKRLLNLFSIVIIITFTALALSSGDSKPDEMLAYTYAENFVKKRLKSPSSAEFPGIFEKKEHVQRLSDNEFFINSWVDSQNGFGAMIRSRFSCKIIFKGDNVYVENLVIE